MLASIALISSEGESAGNAAWAQLSMLSDATVRMLSMARETAVLGMVEAPHEDMELNRSILGTGDNGVSAQLMPAR